MDTHPSNPPTVEVRLRDVTDADLAIFFEQQLDADANHMAAFTTKNPADTDAFMAHWARIRADETVTNQTILANGQVAGHVARYEVEPGRPEISYWLGKEYWGRGIATRALAAFLRCMPARPIYARAAKDNLASLRVLEKCGFTIRGEDTDFANARGQVIAEYVLVKTEM